MPYLSDPEMQPDGSDCKDIGILFDRFYMKIYRYLYYKIGDVHVAEDLAKSDRSHVVL